MLEGLAAWVLNTYLGQYLENLNTDQLSVGLLQGAVELENVPLRRDALAGLDVPFRVTAGFVGRIRLCVPVRRLRSEPWSVSIEQLYVVLGPVLPDAMDADAEQEAAQQRALRQLDAEEVAWRSQHEAHQQSSYYAASYSSWLSYGSGIVSGIVANLQLSIRDVHVRYEDSVSLPGRTVAAGVTLAALTAQSCDSHWVPGYVAEAPDSMRFKLLELQRLDVYWDTDAEMYADMPLAQLAEKMIASNRHEFLLSPVSLEARWKQDCREQPLRSRGRPRHTLQLQCRRLCLSLSSRQFQQAVQWMRSVELLNRRRRHLRHRPADSVLRAPRQWWQFAILSHLEPIRTHRTAHSWDSAVTRAGQTVQYADVYCCHLRCPATLSRQQLALKDQVERSWPEEPLRALRSWCMYRVSEEERQADARARDAGLLQSWFPLWGGWYQQQSSQEDLELEAAIASSLENSSTLTRDSVFCLLSFSLKQTEIRLTGGNGDSLFELSLERSEVGAEWRPRTGSHQLQLSLGAVLLQDHATPGSAFPRLVAPLRREPLVSASFRSLSRLPGVSSLLAPPGSEPPLLELLYECRPAGTRADYRLHITSRSLEVVYNPVALNAIKDFFSVPDRYADKLAEIGEAARARYQQTRQELLHSWEQMLEGDSISRKYWDVRLNISAPHVILPEKLQDSSSLMLVLDFGHFKLHDSQFMEEERQKQLAAEVADPNECDEEDDDFQTPCSTPPTEVPESSSSGTISMATVPELPAMELQRRMYDRFSVELSELQVLVGCVRDNWRLALAKGTSHLHLLDKFSVSLQLERRRLPSVDPQWPLFKLTGSLNQLMLHASEHKIYSLLTLLRTFALRDPESADGQESAPAAVPVSEEEDRQSTEECESAACESVPLVVCQFGVGQVALSVESRGRAVAELQVSNARLAFTKRRHHLSVQLTVHSLLLVDALQTYGPDFEILVASHRGVSVDSVSGSLLDSEPCSPRSAGSPDPLHRATSPLTLSQAVHSRLMSVALEGADLSADDAAVQDALITLHLSVTLPEPGQLQNEILQQISAKFNTLDVIANQETIMELVNFIQRVSNPLPTECERTTSLHSRRDGQPHKTNSWFSESPQKSTDSDSIDASELDCELERSQFPMLSHSRSSFLTSTDQILSSTRIEQTSGNDIGESGNDNADDSPTNTMEKNIFVDASRNTPDHHEYVNTTNALEEPLPSEEAGRTDEERVPATRTELKFDFHKLNVLLVRCVVDQGLNTARKVATVTASGAQISASVCGSSVSTSGALGGLQVRSLLPSAGGATHPCVLSVGHDPVVGRSQDLLQRLSAQLYDDGARPALQFKTQQQHWQLQLASVCYTHAGQLVAEVRGCVDEFAQYVNQLAGAAAHMAREQPDVSVSCVLETPILVLPESGSCSHQVLVAHLGQISFSNSSARCYQTDIRDMNLYSLDLERSLHSRGLSAPGAFSVLRADQLYDVRCCGDPILYDTALQVSVSGAADNVQLDGHFTTPVRLSVLKSQYEQILRTLNSLTAQADTEPDSTPPQPEPEPEQSAATESGSASSVLHGCFRLPEFEMELRSDVQGSQAAHGLVTLTLYELNLQYDRQRSGLTQVEVTLQEVTMEDLLQEPNATHRFLLSSLSRVQDSVAPTVPPCLSTSCPDLLQMESADVDAADEVTCGSLPGRLSCNDSFSSGRPPPRASVVTRRAPVTPPPSPRHTVSPCAAISPRKPSAFQQTAADSALIHCTVTVPGSAESPCRCIDVVFNCLDVVLSPQSWVMVLDFFGGDQSAADAVKSADLRADESSEPAAAESASAGQDTASSVLSVRVRCLSVMLNRPDTGPLARATISEFECRTVTEPTASRSHGRLGALTLLDLTERGGRLYRERFITTTPEAVHFEFVRHSAPDPQLLRPCDARLKLRMSSALYVHTQRFLTELQLFLARFSRLQQLLEELRSEPQQSCSWRLQLDIHAGAPVLLLPLEAHSPRLLVADLGRLRVTNTFTMNSTNADDSDSVPTTSRRGRAVGRGEAPQSDTAAVLMEQLHVTLSDMDVYTGRRVDALSAEAELPDPSDLSLGSYLVRADQRRGRIMQEKFCLQLAVARVLDTVGCQRVPDLSITGSLSTLCCALDLSQYRLIRGILERNLGEPVELQPETLIQPLHTPTAAAAAVWLCFRFRLSLQNVSLALLDDDASALARFDFIRSQLMYDSFSDSSKDVALVSQEIQLTDTRYCHLPANKRPSVFSSILQPLRVSTDRQLRAEVHYRASADRAQFSVVLNSMRLLGVPDWWTAVYQFLTTGPDSCSTPAAESESVALVGLLPPAASAPVPVGVGLVTRRAAPIADSEHQLLDTKLNVSDCELVLPESPRLADTAAVILKASTACVTYRPSAREKPLSCELQGCELFSCVLGSAEKETALSIVDPFTVSVDVSGRPAADAPRGILDVHDTPMLYHMSVHTQQLSVRLSYHDGKMFLSMLESIPRQSGGSQRRDSQPANMQSGEYTADPAPDEATASVFSQLRHVELHVTCLSLCVIDDCGDADVPLLELCLNHCTARRDADGGGQASCQLSVEYYNRQLSGWEPLLEQVRCSMTCLCRPQRIKLCADNVINLNVTSTALQLYRSVSASWTQDNDSRRRAPFQPFCLHNDTGCALRMRTETASADVWTSVPAAQSAPFSFPGARAKLRHEDTRSVRQRRLVVWVQGWQPTSPVSVDQVGVYFRECACAPGSSQAPGRLVLAVTMDGAARKLVTVRSALLLHNQLPMSAELSGPTSDTVHLESGQRRPVPLRWIHAPLSVRVRDGPDRWTDSCQPWMWWNNGQVRGSSGLTIRQCVSLFGSTAVSVSPFRFCIDARRDGYPNTSPDSDLPQPGHTVVLLPPLVLRNLLPCELRYSVHQAGLQATPRDEGRVSAGAHTDLLHVDTQRQLYVTVWAEGFRAERPLELWSARASGAGALSLALCDDRGRRLLLGARLQHGPAGWSRLTVSSPYWLLNRTGLPLVAGQEGAETSEAAGQEMAHERARSVAPLLFSLSDPEAPHMMVLRVGRGQHTAGSPRWCSRFPLQPGLCQRRLRFSPADPSQPDWIYEVGVCVRPGRGRYSDTHVVTVAPRFQLENRTSRRLMFSQLAFARDTPEPECQRTWLCSMPHSQMAFHWPRHDLERLLCVRLTDPADCGWSGAFRIGRTDSLYVNMRDAGGGCRLLRVEVVPQDATFHVVLVEADCMPPPIRLYNTAEVSITFQQSAVREPRLLRGVVRPGTSVPYAWDKPLQLPRSITLLAPGGRAEEYDIEQLGEARQLLYDNMMFLAFSSTFAGSSTDPQFVECRQLVLDVVQGAVVLRRKANGARSQLWRHLNTGHLVHEGSMPPSHQRVVDSRLVVLDISAAAVQPSRPAALCVRRVDPRRALTQMWGFSDAGRLQCRVQNVCVQAAELTSGALVLLGPVSSGADAAVQSQPQWPGSGQLAVRVHMDGPTRVLHVSDAQRRSSRSDQLPADAATGSSWSLQLPAGLSVSLVTTNPAEELLCAHFSAVSVEVRRSGARLLLDGSIAQLQVDCHLTDTPAPVVLYVTPAPADVRTPLPAVAFNAHCQYTDAQTASIFKHLVLEVKDLTVMLEERLLYQLLLFWGLAEDSAEADSPDESERETQRALSAATSVHNRRYYFSRLEVALRRVRISVLTTSKLRADQAAVRRKLGLRLVQFENALVELDKFVRTHVFETMPKIMDSLQEHYREELKSQAAIILGSTDFLGNPLGFINDVSEGVSGLVTQGDVGGLLKNVTHGMANSAAKMTGSLSDVVGWAAMDEKHEDARRRLRERHTAADDHLAGAFKGLGLGLWGGASSLVVQPIQGAADQGLWGFFSGIGKGIVGTVAKPAVGLLDLATGTANAVKDTSSRAGLQAPARVRAGRIVQGHGGLLPGYRPRDAEGQQLLLSAADGQLGERYLAYELLHAAPASLQPTHPLASVCADLRSVGPGDLRVLLSTEAVRVFSHVAPGQFSLERSVPLSVLLGCAASVEPMPGGAQSYHVTLKTASGGGRPALRCSSPDVALRVAELINYGIACHEELRHTLPAPRPTDTGAAF